MRSPITTSSEHIHLPDFVDRGIVISCEHGGNHIPLEYQHLFQPHQGLLNTHRGYDMGALTMAKMLATALKAPLVSATVSRLLTDLNRSQGHPQLHAEFIRSLPAETRERIVRKYYQPYRQRAEYLVRQTIAHHGKVIHLSSHSFTPQLYGVIRNADIGLLYDPAYPAEIELGLRWKSVLKRLAPHLRVRRNYPYAGKNDGLTSWFRAHLPAGSYTGIELEINQRLITGNRQQWAALRQLIVVSFMETTMPAGVN